MKNKNYIFLLPLLLIISACSTTQHSEKKVIEEAKVEGQFKDSEETQAKILEILKQDTSVLDSDRKTVISIIDNGFAEYKKMELLANQQKALLIREYMNQKPNKNKIHSIQSAIKKIYAKKSDLLMECFDHIAKVMKLHPESAGMFFERANSFWPMRDRAI